MCNVHCVIWWTAIRSVWRCCTERSSCRINKSYFTKVDIRTLKAIKLYSKSAKLLTMHPSSSYKLERDAQKQYVLHITNPQILWSTSKYLVVQVK